MKINVIKTLVPLLTGVASAAAAGTASNEQAAGGVLLWFFIGFGVMVLVFQAAPALIVFASILKGLFSSDPSEASFSPFKGKNNP